jgi:hypothetical protein
VVARVAALTLVPLPAAMHAWLRSRDLAKLSAAGPVGALVARQSEMYGADHAMADLGRAHAFLPDDLVNFHWDPVTAAVAVGWEGAALEARTLATRVDDGVLRFVDDRHGCPVDVLRALDGAAFTDLFLERVAASAGT